VVWPGYEGLYLAVTRGDVAPYHIRLVSFPSLTEVLRALQAGQIDAAALTSDEFLRAASDAPGDAPRVVLVLDISNGGDAIVARPPIGQMSELRGRRIGVESTALGALVLARALGLHGMQPRDVTVVQVPVFDQERAYRAGRIDAAVTFEPTRSRLMAAGGRVIFDSQEIAGEIVDLLVVRPAALPQAAPALRALVAAWFRAQAFAAAHPDEAALSAARRLQITPADYQASLAGLIIPDLSMVRHMLGNDPGNLAVTLTRVSAFMRANGLLTASAELAPLFDPGFLPPGPP
jgi:NitT/TauT family transport system substrate-binding protein